MTNRHVDEEINRLAARQYGAFNRPQAIHRGASKGLIDRRVENGAWLRLDPAVYALPGNPATWHRQVKAAELSAPNAVVSGSSAAVLHKLDGCRPGRPEITVPYGTNARSGNLARIRRSRRPTTSTTVDRIVVTTTELTVLGIAGQLSAMRLRAIVDDAAFRDILDTHVLGDLVLSYTGTGLAGFGRLNHLLMDLLAEDEVPLESMLELELSRSLVEAEVPGVEYQCPLPWWPSASQRVDVVVPAARTIVEGDGRDWHTRRRDFERDHERDNQAGLHDWHVLRYTWHQLTRRRDTTLAELRQLAAKAARCEHPAIPM